MRHFVKGHSVPAGMRRKKRLETKGKRDQSVFINFIVQDFGLDGMNFGLIQMSGEPSSKRSRRYEAV